MTVDHQIIEHSVTEVDYTLFHVNWVPSSPRLFKLSYIIYLDYKYINIIYTNRVHLACDTSPSQSFLMNI